MCNTGDCPQPCILDYSDLSKCATNDTDSFKWHSQLTKIGTNATLGACIIDDITYPFELYNEGVSTHQICEFCNTHTCTNSNRSLFATAADIHCENDICTDEVCCEPSCTDGIQNGDEEDVDCGG